MEDEEDHRNPVPQKLSVSPSTNSISERLGNSISENKLSSESSAGDKVIADDKLLSQSDQVTPRDLVVYNVGIAQNGAGRNGSFEEFGPEDDDSQDGCDSSDWGNKPTKYIEFCEIERSETENLLLMGTSTAFGTSDWHDFEQESNGGIFASLDMKTLTKTHDSPLDSTLFDTSDWHDFEQESNGGTFTTHDMKILTKTHNSPLDSSLFDTIDTHSVSQGSEFDGSVDEKGVEDCSTNHLHIEVRSNSSHEFEATPLHDTNELSGATTQELSINPTVFEDDIVREMEEILLDARGQTTAKFSPLDSPNSISSRDGGLFASTSNYKDYPSTSRINVVEVIGAKQKKGNVSLSERLVGVKEYTVYSIRVWSEEHHWVVERRYREFYSLFCNLKSYFFDHGWTLPSQWSAIEQESRKLFGSSSPDVVQERSALIQNCLQSVINNDSFPSFPGEFHWFLSAVPVSSHSERVSLLVEDHQEKPLKQILESQVYYCFGCRRKLDDEKGTLRGFVQSLGWGNPRLCMYTGQVFCSTCHVNDHVILPSRVLHHWDFTQYPVSQSSKSYLDSIYDQPMLCVSAVNPFLYSRVPALHLVVALRRKLETIVAFVKCPFRNAITRALGPRKYLLESNDFFAMRDLVDLSKGSFAALPGMLEACIKKISEHIVEHCLICYDVGIPCGSRQACANPSSLVFPFQEEDVEKCGTCGCVYHRVCYMKLERCSCGAVGSRGNDLSFASKLRRMSSRNLLAGTAGWFPSLTFLKPIFSKSDEVNADNVILLGSLPNENFHA